MTNVSIADISGISKTGFYLGPTLKLGLPLGFDIDASLLYNQLEADPRYLYRPRRLPYSR